ncbi:hypothetical protein HPULCUR_009413 [Helicostylum pulchrum]|uniref:K Homology domain-containing protein n=1 Tax=Helicostylum pulchrum TaxID=562976 RepID=A0ABP9YAJ4_9FUNG
MSNTTSEYPDDVVLKQEQDAVLNEEDQLTLRALVSTKEAGVIIGKGGKNVAELRESTGVKAGVSKVVQGVHDRVLTVSGTLEGVAKAYSLIARTMLENPISATTTTNNNNNNNNNTTTSTTNNATNNTAGSPTPTSTTTTTTNTINPVVTLRLLISHNLMGTVIGRQGAKIKHIQDISGVRMTASKALLPQSTERVVEVRGTVSAIQQAVAEIGQCLIEDKDRAYGTILYNPSKVTTTPTEINHNNRRSSITRTGNGSDFSSVDYNQRRSSFNNNPDVRTQHISIPSDMVGCIIGKAGTKISEIRQLSGSHISIAKVPHDESGERMFTIQGTPDSNERALYLLYGQLENEKERRLRGVMQDDVLLEEE